MVVKLPCEVALIAKVNVCAGGMSVDRVCKLTQINRNPEPETPGPEL